MQHDQLTVVIAAYNEAEALPLLQPRLMAVLDELASNTRIDGRVLYVDDGSTDATWQVLQGFAAVDRRVGLLRLSRNFGKEAALTAGLDHVDHGAALILDADGQDPPELIPQFVAKWREGFDDIHGTRLEREGESWLKTATAHAFYRVIGHLSRTPIPRDTGDFRLLSPRALGALKQLRERNRFMKGLFGWVMSAPWRNPAFAGFVLSLMIFGFIGGITGVTLGTQQINIIAHNTLRITGHFHATVVGGTTLAFMALTYYVIPLIFRRDFIWRGAARAQPWLFGGGILLVSLGMSFAGSLGVPRRNYDIESAGIFGPAAHLFLGIMGIGAILAVIGLLLFAALCVGTILFGEKNAGRPMADWGTAKAMVGAKEGSLAEDHWAMKGTIALTGVFLACFAVYYFANWKALADVWPVR